MTESDSLERWRVSPVPFDQHVELLRFFIAGRDGISDRVEAVLNAQRKPIDYRRDSSRLFQHIERCFFAAPGIADRLVRLEGQLDEAHRAAGFAPRRIPGLHNGLIDPGEMTVRAFHLWDETRWPGRNGRVRYAQALFNLYVVRFLVLLSLHLWDDDTGDAGERLARIQEVLDRLWSSSPPGLPVLVRDARWLVQLAQSPATDDLAAYFDIAQKVAETLPERDRIEVHTAGVRMAGGHLRSQLRYHSTKPSVAIDEDRLILSTRTSNALDFALLIQELVPLLAAYEQACDAGDIDRRLSLADAIAQGLSPDPELFMNQLELLGACSMLEHLFVVTDATGQASLTTMGQRHVRLIREYTAGIGRVVERLSADCERFRPTPGTYSPYGVLYGFSVNLLEHMTFRSLQPDAITVFSLEDVFVAGGSDKLAWVNGWRKLPHRRDVGAMFEYPQQFAGNAFDRVARALNARAADGKAASSRSKLGRLFVACGDSPAGGEFATIPVLPRRFVASSDPHVVSGLHAEFCDEAKLLSERREGKFVVSWQTSGGWVALRKALLSEVIGTGEQARVAGLPAATARALALTCPNVVLVSGC